MHGPNNGPMLVLHGTSALTHRLKLHAHDCPMNIQNVQINSLHTMPQHLQTDQVGKVEGPGSHAAPRPVNLAYMARFEAAHMAPMLRAMLLGAQCGSPRGTNPVPSLAGGSPARAESSQHPELYLA
jgi:hypothetical protein